MKKMNGMQEMDMKVYCFEQYLLSHIRSVKLVREIGNGAQRRLSEWVY